jgi:putative membrane protein
MADPAPSHRHEPLVLLAIVAACLVVSGIQPYDRLTWLLEVSWVLVGIPLAVLTSRGWPLTTLLYRLLALHAIILIIGGYYTYERVPLGRWFQQWTGAERNDYDRLGHFFQGFVPAILAREVLVRWSPLRPGALLNILVVALCLAFSACFELLEWFAAVSLGTDADAFLATQGDPWDTQADMLCCLIGALASVALLRKLHDNELWRRGWRRSE